MSLTRCVWALYVANASGVAIGLPSVDIQAAKRASRRSVGVNLFQLAGGVNMDQAQPFAIATAAMASLP